MEFCQEIFDERDIREGLGGGGGHKSIRLERNPSEPHHTSNFIAGQVSWEVWEDCLSLAYSNLD
jgi:hypothetical protein